MKCLRLSIVLCFFAVPAPIHAQNPNCLGPSNEPLVQAIRDGELKKARAMVNSGTTLNIQDQCGAIPLHEAIRWNYTDFALELLSAGADPKFPDGGAEALIGSAFMCNPKLAGELLKRGVPVDAANGRGGTALMEATAPRCKDGTMVQLLLDAGANPNAKTKNDFTALQAAAMTGDAIGAEKLLKAGADPKSKDDRGHTPQDEACDRGEQGHFQVCQLVRDALLALPPTPTETEKITIKNSSVHDSKVLLLEAELAGKPAELECFTNKQSCADLAPGDYSMVRRKTEGLYMDCQNVEVYKRSGATTKDKALGEYCLLQP